MSEFRITPDDIENLIVGEHYFVLSDVAYEDIGDEIVEEDMRAFVMCNLQRVTVCVLTMRNGFVVIGESACVDLENFDLDIGRQIARSNAVDKIWPLVGYELRTMDMMW